MTKVNAQEIISLTDELARIRYGDGCYPEDRLAYQVGILSAKVRELVQIVNGQDDLIDSLTADIKELAKELA